MSIGRKTLKAATATAAVAAAATLGAASPAHAASTAGTMTPIGQSPAHATVTTQSNHFSPHIIGGTVAYNPAYVQLIFGQDGGTYGCTGEAIGSQWVLTARHCVDGISWMDVYYSNSTTNRGTAHPADQVGYSPNGDVALVHLASPKALNSYAHMTSSYTPRQETGTIYGYGLRANQTPTDHLYKANVEINAISTDAYGGEALHVNGIDGASNHGDSGGPLVVGGEIVGVCSTGDSADPGSNTQAGSNYASLTDSRSWVQQVTGI